MKKTCRAFLMMFLIVTIPVYIPVVIAQNDDILPPGDQCYDKAMKGKDFIEFMDGGVINTLEIVSALLFVLGTVMNTIDYFVALSSSIVGMLGPDGSTCCTSVVGAAGACEVQWTFMENWQTSKILGISQGLISVATCECCSSDEDLKLEGVLAFGGRGGLCPLGNLANMLGDKFPHAPVGEQPPSTFVPNDGKTSITRSGGGISMFHISAFDNIYMAVGCMCPVAILFNLRKLKTIYQVHNCCVEQACKNGMSIEACERQFDEASCMYWEGSIMKTVISVIASIAVGYMAGYVAELIKENAIVNCIIMVLDLARIPGRVQAILGAFDWLSVSFSEPKCEDLGFDDIKKQLESGYWSQSAGIRYTMLDTDGDGVNDNIATS